MFAEVILNLKTLQKSPLKQARKQPRGVAFSFGGYFLPREVFPKNSLKRFLGSRLSGGPAGPSQPDLPLSPRPPCEHLRADLIWTGAEIALFGSKSGPHQVWADVFAGGRAQRGRSSCHGPVGPPKVFLRVLRRFRRKGASFSR